MQVVDRELIGRRAEGQVGASFDPGPVEVLLQRHLKAKPITTDPS